MVENENQSQEIDVCPVETVNSSLPQNCFPLTHQVAGHFYGKGRSKLGLLQTNDGLVLKPVQSPPRGQREHNFYMRIFASDQSELNQDEVELKALLPVYRGFSVHQDIVYIKMDDLAHGIRQPAVIDFKMGQRTYDPEASVEKISRQKLKYPPVENIGFQLLGMRVFSFEDNSFAHFDKKFGRTLLEQEVIHADYSIENEGLALFYQFHQTAQTQAIRETIRQFESIKRWFERQTTYHFYSSSLIVVYEAKLEDLHQQNNMSESMHQLVKIKMADFAHVFPAESRVDENYLFGLNRLIEHLKQLLSSDYVFKDVRYR